MIGGMVAIILLVVIAGIHVYWAAGGRFGHGAAIPEHDSKPAFQPTAIATLAVAVALLVGAALIAMVLGLLPVPALVRPRWVRILVWLMALVFAARAIGDFRSVGFFKRASRSRFARLDTRFYSPLCVLLAAASADAAWESSI